MQYLESKDVLLLFFCYGSATASEPVYFLIFNLINVRKVLCKGVCACLSGREEVCKSRVVSSTFKAVGRRVIMK